MKQFAVTTGLLVAVALSSFAQMGGEEMRASIPFNFRIGDTFMPAGNYSVHQSGGLLVVKQRGGSLTSAMKLTIPASRSNAPSNPVLEFHQYGETYFLASVWDAQSTEGHALTNGKTEREFARHLGTVETEVALTTK